MEENKENPWSQVCVWPATMVGKEKQPTPEEIKEFEEYFPKEVGWRVKFLECVETLPDMKDGEPVRGTGGRMDVFLSIHKDDLGKAAVPRLQMGMRWWEDVIGNGNHRIYPKEIIEKYPKTW